MKHQNERNRVGLEEKKRKLHFKLNCSGEMKKDIFDKVVYIQPGFESGFGHL